MKPDKQIVEELNNDFSKLVHNMKQIKTSIIIKLNYELAIMFLQWVADNRVSISVKRRDSEQFFYNGKEITATNLFQEFLKCTNHDQ